MQDADFHRAKLHDGISGHVVTDNKKLHRKTSMQYFSQKAIEISVVILLRLIVIVLGILAIWLGVYLIDRGVSGVLIFSTIPFVVGGWLILTGLFKRDMFG